VNKKDEMLFAVLAVNNGTQPMLCQDYERFSKDFNPLFIVY